MNKTKEAIKKYVKEAIKKESQTINELKKILKEPINMRTENILKTCSIEQKTDSNNIKQN
jgi:ribosomal protein L4